VKRERIVVAMSGGVDSSVAAALCVEAGYEVIGVSLRLARDGEGSCCSLDDFLDARAVADRLGFPHYVFDLRDLFERRVVQPFVDEYLAGRTPNPCARCNQHVKFDWLWQRTRELGATKLATGHYARIAPDPATGRPVLRAARDALKDQSYFLFTLTADVLAHTLFPIGEMVKDEVRAMAATLGLATAAKPESMEVCFVPRGDAGGFVAGHAPADRLRPGVVVDETGAVVGRHDGVHRFTVGQRRGLALGGGPRRYVRAIDARSGTVAVTDASGLHSRGLVARDVIWSAGSAPGTDVTLGVRIRHRHPLVAGRIVETTERTVAIAFDDDGPAVTPGQAAVVYRGDVVLGGGWIVGELAA